MKFLIKKTEEFIDWDCFPPERSVSHTYFTITELLQFLLRKFNEYWFI